MIVTLLGFAWRPHPNGPSSLLLTGLRESGEPALDVACGTGCFTVWIIYKN